MWKKGKMDGYSVHEALYQNFETHGPWVRFRFKSALNWPLRPYSENVLNPRKSYSLLPYKGLYMILVKFDPHAISKVI